MLPHSLGSRLIEIPISELSLTVYKALESQNDQATVTERLRNNLPKESGDLLSGVFVTTIGSVAVFSSVSPMWYPSND